MSDGTLKHQQKGITWIIRFAMERVQKFVSIQGHLYLVENNIHIPKIKIRCYFCISALSQCTDQR